MTMPLSQHIRSAIKDFPKQAETLAKKAFEIEQEIQKFTRINGDFAHETTGMDLQTKRLEYAQFYVTCRQADKKAQEIFHRITEARNLCDKPLSLEGRAELRTRGFTDELITQSEDTKKELTSSLAAIANTIDSIQKTIYAKKRTLAPLVNTTIYHIDCALDNSWTNKILQLKNGYLATNKANLDQAILDLGDSVRAEAPSSPLQKGKEQMGPTDELAMLQHLSTKLKTLSKKETLEGYQALMNAEPALKEEEKKEPTEASSVSSEESSLPAQTHAVTDDTSAMSASVVDSQETSLSEAAAEKPKNFAKIAAAPKSAPAHLEPVAQQKQPEGQPAKPTGNQHPAHSKKPNRGPLTGSKRN